MSITDNIKAFKTEIESVNVRLVAVSKTKPIEDLMEAYNAGQRIFGENQVQELANKYEQLPKDIEWHLIGHLQTNKVKYIAPFISLIHSVDSLKLLTEINKQAEKTTPEAPRNMQRTLNRATDSSNNRVIFGIVNPFYI